MAHSIDRNREVEVRRWRHWERRESLTKETEREVELGKQEKQRCIGGKALGKEERHKRDRDKGI